MKDIFVSAQINPQAYGKTAKVNKLLLTLTSYSGYFLIGFISIVFAPSLPYMIRDYNLTLSAAGAVFTARAAGSFLGVLGGGILSDKLGRKPLIVCGCLIQGIGMAVIAATSNWDLTLILFAVIGIASGFLNTSLNALVAEMNEHRRGAAMNALHGIYGLGSLIGPVAAGLALALQFGWRLVFYGTAALWFIYMFIIMPLKYPPIAAKVSIQQKDISVKAIPIKTFFLNQIFIMLIIVSFIYNGVATGLAGWINTYMDGMKFPMLLGAGMITIFYSGLTAGRFTCSIYSDRIGFSRTILICSLGSLLSYPLAIFAAQPFIIAAGVFFSGFFFSGLHPTGLAYANKLFPSAAGTVSGILSMSMALGAMGLPWLIGIMADHIGFKPGLSIGFIMIVLLTITVLRLIHLEKGSKLH